MGTCSSSSCKCFAADLQQPSYPPLEVVAAPDDDSALFRKDATDPLAGKSKVDNEAGAQLPNLDLLPEREPCHAEQTWKTETDSVRGACDDLTPTALRGEELEVDTQYQSPRSSSLSGRQLPDDLLQSQLESDSESTEHMLDNGGDNDQDGAESYAESSCPLSPLFEEEAKEAKRQRTASRSSREVTRKTKAFTSDALKVVLENHTTKIDSLYTIQDSLGTGSFGAVMKAKLKASGATRAVKKISKDAMNSLVGNLKPITREISVMKKLDHPHVIKLYEIFETSTDILLVMELCGCGTLTDLVKKRGASTEHQAAEIMRQVISAVFYMHKNYICHRDLKPDNLLLAAHHPLVLKVVDFGVSCVFLPGRLMTKKAGTVAFMAPEVLRKRYNHNCDMWSCGVILYYTLCGYLPFIGETDKDVARCVMKGTVVFETVEWVDVKAHTMDFIGLLLKRNFRARYTAEQALHHDWFNTYVEQISRVHLRHDLLSNLYSFRKLNKLKRSALTVLASMLRAEDVKEGHNVFVSLDNNGDGSLSISELRKALAKQRGAKTPAGNLEGYFQDPAHHTADDKLNPFTYTEFLAATFDRNRCITDKLLKAVFATFDKNADGNIALSELSEGILLGNLSLEELSQLFEELDVNGDCFLDFSEFAQMMRT